MNDSLKRLRIVFAFGATAALAAVAYTALPGTPARGQDVAPPPIVFKSAGPVGLNHSESALIGLLLPAVQRAERPYRLQVFDSAGKLLADLPVAPNAETRTGVFFNVVLADGSVRVLDHGKPVGEPSRLHDGQFSTVLLPAVQSERGPVGPISASVQIVTGEHNRGQVIAMGDGSV